jgi:hypothetical protein
MNGAEIRERLATELRLDLIGPSHHDAALVNEILADPRWPSPTPPFSNDRRSDPRDPGLARTGAGG